MTHNDPMLEGVNCSAGICCPPQKALGASAALAVSHLGMDQEEALKYAQKMRDAGLCLMPQKLADIIAEIANHPGRAV